MYQGALTTADAVGVLTAAGLDTRGAAAVAVALATGATTRATLATGETAGETIAEPVDAGFCRVIAAGAEA